MSVCNMSSWKCLYIYIYIRLRNLAHIDSWKCLYMYLYIYIRLRNLAHIDILWYTYILIIYINIFTYGSSLRNVMDSNQT